MNALAELHPRRGLGMLKGRQTDRFKFSFGVDCVNLSSPFRAAAFFVGTLGLKPQAESFNPFGISLG